MTKSRYTVKKIEKMTIVKKLYLILRQILDKLNDLF